MCSRSGGKKGRQRKDNLIKRDGVKCCFCGVDTVRVNWKWKRITQPNDMTIEHIIPVSEGGTNELSNLKISCDSCNTKRGITNFIDFKTMSIQ